MSKKVITLPDREEMLQRLLKVSDDSYMQKRFFPILLKSAGQKRVAVGVAVMLTLAIHEFVRGMPPVMANVMFMQAPQFIDAIVDDPEVAGQAKTFLQETLAVK